MSDFGSGCSADWQIGDWQIQIIFTQRNQYRAQIFVYA